MSSSTDSPDTDQPLESIRVRSDVPFYSSFGFISAFYVAMILAMLIAEMTYTSPGHVADALRSREVRYSIRLSLLSCAVTTILALWVSVPIGYLMSRHRFPGRSLVDAVLDIPIVLPPLVIGLCLLILFSSPFSAAIEGGLISLGVFVSANLVPLCEQHHHLVHEGGWKLTMTRDRVATWSRPDGTTHLVGSTIDRINPAPAAMVDAEHHRPMLC
jgi:hypothetical protein